MEESPRVLHQCLSLHRCVWRKRLVRPHRS
jgi:hypothetical protein